MYEVLLNVRFAPALELDTRRNGSLVLTTNHFSLRLPALLQSHIPTLQALLGDGMPQQDALNLGSASADFELLAAWRAFLQALSKRGLVLVEVRCGAEVLLTLIPTSDQFRWPMQHELPDRLALSRFAQFRREGRELLMESPLAHCRAILSESALQSLFGLVRSDCTAGALACFEDRQRGAGRLVLNALNDVGFLLAPDKDGHSHEDHPPLQYWEFHDLAFHARSRRGRHARPMGATFRFSARPPSPTPVQPTPESARCISLPSPDPEALTGAANSLGRALRERCSTRTQGATPISLTQLARLLFHSASAVRCPLGNGNAVLRRPYPSGGARYSLEIYAAVRSCDGLAPGLYRYAAIAHNLILVRGWCTGVSRLMEEASVAHESPQVLLVLAARFEHVSTKYESIAYSLILKEAGALLQTLYLVAATMGVGVCAVGNGDSDLFASVVGQSPYVEAPVAELVIGSMPEPLKEP